MAFIWLYKKYVSDSNPKASLPPPCAHQPKPSARDEASIETTGDGTPLVNMRIGSPELSSKNAQSTTLPRNQDPRPPCQVCQEETLAARRYRIKIIAGIVLPAALSSLDTTIVASALPWIASDFNRMSQMNWITSAFNLCAATFVPFWGQIADIFGRTITMEVLLFLIMVGSALSVAAPVSAFPLLIIGRAIQGLAVSGTVIGIKIILADKVSLKENAKNNSIFSLFAGISFGVGPVIGGYLTDANWRWCFGINLPIAAVAMLIIWFVLRPELLGPQPLPELESLGSHAHRFVARISTIDYGGQFLFLGGMALIILSLTWGGATYAWNSAQVIAPLVIGSVLFILFGFWQYLMSPSQFLALKYPQKRPTIPWKLLSQRNMYLLFYINFASGMATTSVLYFIDIYFTLVFAYSPSKAGIQLLYWTPGLGVGVILATILCNKNPKQTFTPLLLGSFLEALGITLLLPALHVENKGFINGMMLLTGAGTGIRFMPGTIHGIGFFPGSIAAVVSCLGIASPFGQTVGMTIMNTVFNNKAGFAISASDSSVLGELSGLSDIALAIVKKDARTGVVWAFVAILPFMWLCVLAAACLGNVDITTDVPEGVEGQPEDGEKRTVYEGFFILELMRRAVGKGRKGEIVGERVDTGEKVGKENVRETGSGLV